MEIWTEAETKPPKETCFYFIHNVGIRESLSSMITILTTAANIGLHHPSWTQIKVFRFMQCKLLSKVPCSNFLPVFERIGRVIQKMVLVDLSKLYTDFADTFIKGLARSSLKVKLPSRIHLEYILIRTQGSAKLICEALSYLRNIFCYLVEHLSDGPNFCYILSACSVIAKISTYFNGLLWEVCNIYLKVKPYLEELQSGKFKWKHELNLPENLWSWCKSEESFDITEGDLPVEKVRLVTEMLRKSHGESTRKEHEESSVNDRENELFEKNFSVIEVIETKESHVIDSDIEVIDLDKDLQSVEINLEKGDVVNPRIVGKGKKRKKCIESSSSKMNRKKGKLEEVAILEVKNKKKKKHKESNIPINSKKNRTLQSALFELKCDILKASTCEILLSIWEDIKTESKLIKHKHLSSRSAKKLKKLFRKLKQKLTFNEEGSINLEIDKVKSLAEIFANRLELKFNES